MRRLWTAMLCAVALLGCASHEYRVESRPPEPRPIADPARYHAAEKPVDAQHVTAEATAKTDLGGEIYAVQRSGGGAIGLPGMLAAPPPPPAVTPPSPVEVGSKSGGAAAEMIDLEARVELEVETIESALVRIRLLVRDAGGQTVNEVIEDKSSTSGAALSVRVPTGKAEQLLTALGKVGKLLSRKVEAKDIGREYHDAEVLLRNLQVTLARYEQLLAKAENASQVLEVERELSRVRTELDRVKGDMQWLRDRAARATIYITLSSPQDSSIVEPEAQLYPGVRATSLFDLSESDGTRTFVGAGVSVMFTRVFSLDADWMTRTSDGDGVDLFIGSAGVEIYSDLLGGGKRRYFNPYLGFRTGYARVLGDGVLAAGGSLGLEIVKTDIVVFDLHARFWALIGIEDATHAAIQPGFGLNLAY